MAMNNIQIVQRDNVYQLHLPNQLCIAQLAFPPDHQYYMDAKALDSITRAMSFRWEVYQPQKKQGS